MIRFRFPLSPIDVCESCNLVLIKYSGRLPIFKPLLTHVLGEIFETYGKLNSNNLSFIPTSGSFIRGIFLNCFVETNQNYHFDEISNDFSNTIKNSKFYRHQDEIRISNVIGSNYFDINFKFLPNNNLLIQSCLDNLVKGAAGNAIQCMNIMFNIDEDTGLNKLIPMYI